MVYLLTVQKLPFHMVDSLSQLQTLGGDRRRNPQTAVNAHSIFSKYTALHGCSAMICATVISILHAVKPG